VKGGEEFWKGIGSQFENSAEVSEWPFHSEEWNSGLLSYRTLVTRTMHTAFLNFCYSSCILVIASSLSLPFIHRSSHIDRL
jgi:hypothetical protein